MKSLRILTVGVLAAAFATTLLPGTQAYTKTGYKWPTMNVSFYVNPANQDVSPTAAIAAIQAGLAAWSTQAGTPFRFSYAGQVSTTTTGYDNKNIIVFRNTTNGGSIATSYWWHSSGNLVDSDIIFWDGARKFFTGSSGCTSGTQAGAYVEDVATHELGHSLGLGHSGVNEATMYASYSACSQAMRTLASDDIAGARSLYGTSSTGGSTGGTPDTTPTVTVLAPANGLSVASGTTIAFSGSAVDTPDGTISSRLVWRSSRDGQIGTGASFSRTLTAGSHTITASVTDSTGHTGQASVGVTLTTTSSTTSGAKLTATATTQSDGQYMTKLSWTGLTTENVDIYRNSVKVGSTRNDGAAGNYVSAKGTYAYKLCNYGMSSCTNLATVTY